MRKLFAIGAVALLAVLITACGSKEIPPTPVPPPAESVLINLAKGTLALFEQAIKTNDFTDYYNAMSSEYTSFTGQDRLTLAYKKVVDAEHDISGVLTVEPIITVSAKNFRVPTLQRSQIIEFEGDFRITPVPVSFKLRYVLEDGVWRLFTHTIKVE
jgi:hypothetical protein